jgi:hypothetical protein
VNVRVGGGVRVRVGVRVTVAVLVTVAVGAVTTAAPGVGVGDIANK